MKALVCLVLGHGKDVMHEDGKGAAWTTCARCGAFRQGHSWHGRKPWLQ